MVRRGRLTARKGNTGRLLIEVPPDLIRLASAPAAAGAEAADARVAGLEWAVEEWRAAAEEARLLRDELARERERVGRLEGELAELRRPWWARFVSKR